ncbi:divergent polysaccharide deacetylase family protein [Acidilutibacter cellobiosedens]|uniref:Divergent polysaccharide deacetylase family protein n=1 Tax=Acidilutibacter cellobiosedens TaxID=2507161 RepID=A0A410QGD7_9FIRM|nr:divergent polysaccharide deacetylase family protein [Acidilutibacter cellobiosedens]QAT63162.1 divergent polysaccharide deacetylase family protein [Acidilutibacter cellobiosedens]
MLYIKRKVLYIMVIAIIMSIFIPKFIFKYKAVSTYANKKSYIALVIDDLGEHGDGTDELLKLDIPVTVAVMPFLECSKEDAELFHNVGFEVILHLPMESETGNKKWLGPKPITSSMTNEEIRNVVNEGLDEIKWAKGINNHMGSKSIKDERIMAEVLKVAQENNLFFLDSKTGTITVAKNISEKLNVMYFERDIFLDNSKSEKEITKAMDKLEDIAKSKGYAVGIGHIGGQGGKVTVNIINKMSKEMKNRGIEFVYLSELKRIADGSEKVNAD